ncbi:MAG TPA: glycosyltransferase family 87 protein [Gemmataceae bacterium]|nr:glycosyltransferase family 87 protein [Gemmataceae bacterium]
MSTSTLRPPLAAPWQRWFVAGLLLFFAALSAKYTVKVLDPHSPRSAIQRWYDQLKSLDEDANPWERFNYPNPPIMALLLRPLLLLPPVAAALVWFYLKVGMTLVAFSWVFRLVEAPGQPFPPWAKALTVVLSVRPVMGDLIHGNVNLFILFLVVAALYAFRRGRDLTSGTLLALAVACKVTPALFIPYLVWKRAWKALLGCGVGLVLFFWLVPACFLGWQQNAEDLRSWVDNMVVPFVIKGNVTSEHNNQSLPGLVFRMTTHSPSFSTYEHDRYKPLEYDNLVSLDPAVARLLLKGCMGLFALLVVWACRTPTAPRHGWRLAAEFGVVLLGMLLFSERTWKHHCVTLLVPFAVLVYYLAACRPGGVLRGYLIGSLVAAALLMLVTSTGLFEDLRDQAAVPANLSLTNKVGKLAQVYGAYVWAYLVLLAALVVLLRSKARPAATTEPPGAAPV